MHEVYPGGEKKVLFTAKPLRAQREIFFVQSRERQD
jgi:hypothetical protein